MRDGKSLAANIFFPPTVGKYPAILVQTPYNKDYFGAVVGERVLGRRVRRKVHGMYDRRHYVYVIVDWRGFYASRKAALGLARVRRGPDGFDCVEWIARQPWCNGRVGTWGGSALGKQQFDTAAEHPPHLVCCVPLIAVMGQRYEFYYSGGVFRQAHIGTLKRLGYAITDRILDAPYSSHRLWTWAKRLTYKPGIFEVPMLLVTGWWDHFPDAIIDQFEFMLEKSGPLTRKNSRILVGPWSHMEIDKTRQADLAFADAADVEKKATMAFFDYWLRKQKENGWDRVSRFRYYRAFDGPDGRSGRWMEVERWPGVKVAIRQWFGLPDGTLARTRPAKIASETAPQTLRYTFDPRDPVPTLGGSNLPPLPAGPTDHSRLQKRANVLTYSSQKLKEPIRVVGNMAVTFTFSIDRVDADFAVILCDGLPDGKACLVVEAVQRAKLRLGGRPAPLEPGREYRMTIKLPKTAYTFGKGHVLKLFIASSNYPRYERNTHTGADHWDAAKALELTATLFHDDQNPLVLSLPVQGE
jgi:predicted acyl esterase